MTDTMPFWLAGMPATGDGTIDIRSPYDGRPVAKAAVPTISQVEQAVAAADEVRQDAVNLPALVRADALTAVSEGIAQRAGEIAQLITAESGKPIKWATAEVSRAISTFRYAAEEVRRWSGHLQRLDIDQAGLGRLALTRRFPHGPVLGISPFNFPLNLVAHKVAPALAVGTPIVVKPSPRTPLTSLLLGEIIAGTDLPQGMFSVLPVPNDHVQRLVEDPRLPVISFTGSVQVGWSIRESVPRKHVILELGGNAAVIVCLDYPDIEHAAQRIATYSNYQAGQSCIAVQRVYIAHERFEEVSKAITSAVEKLNMGDPAHEQTDVGPLITEEAINRIDDWVSEARAGGATVLAGGEPAGSSYRPTVLSGVPANAKVLTEEVFGPVLVLIPYESVHEAFRMVNDSRYGLQAGVFTRDLGIAFHAHRALTVGGVIIGDVPSYRADHMPYGGTKDSGIGREGVPAAMEDLTHSRVLVLSGIDL